MLKDICVLEKYERVSGDTTSIKFILKNRNDLRGFNIVYTIFNARDNVEEVRKENLVIEDDSILVDFECEDTQDLKGTYIHKVEAYGVDRFDKKKHYVLGQGELSFIQQGACL